MTRVAIVALLCACTTARWDRGTLATSTTMLACDWAQTRSSASRGWPSNHEENAILGTRPSTRALDAYFLIVAAANVAAWLALPAKWRGVAQLGVVGVQTNSIARNAVSVERPWCGVR